VALAICESARLIGQGVLSLVNAVLADSGDETIAEVVDVSPHDPGCGGSVEVEARGAKGHVVLLEIKFGEFEGDIAGNFERMDSRVEGVWRTIHGLGESLGEFFGPGQVMPKLISINVLGFVIWDGLSPGRRVRLSPKAQRAGDGQAPGAPTPDAAFHGARA
jgi:hypothetical protein